MVGVNVESITEQLELCDQLLAGRDRMLEPRDLPGRYGRVVRALDRVLELTSSEAVLAGGWAVWRHGFTGRMTQDVDIVLAADRIEEFQRVALVSGFDVLTAAEGRWPKLHHKDTDVTVDILPEHGRPGTASKPAPTTIRHPMALGASGTTLSYIELPALVELKLAAGRMRDEADVVELVRANPNRVGDVRDHLARVHQDYVSAFQVLVRKADEQEDH